MNLPELRADDAAASSSKRRCWHAAWASSRRTGTRIHPRRGGQRAGTSRPVLYRRWADKDELVGAAIVHELRRDRPDAARYRIPS